MSQQFVHLHTHSEYSILDGLSRVKALVQRAKEHGQPALALTDHGNLYGAVEFYRAAKEAGIKPILGVEGYMARGSMEARDASERFPYHLTLLIKDAAGYANLIKLVSEAHLRGFYYKPRFDWEMLKRHSEGLIALSGCLSGELQSALMDGRDADAKAVAERFKGVFGERYFIEIMFHEGIQALEGVNRKLVDLARECGVPLVATNDSHYTNKEDAEVHDLLLCIQTNAKVEDKSRMQLDGSSFYLRSSEEMRALCGDLAEAADNTLRIAEMVQTPELITGEFQFPHYPTPQGVSAMEYLRTLCAEGLARRYDTVTPQAQERLEQELGVIEQTGFANYFLVCWDIFKFVNQKKILSAVRGSAAASLVLYALEVSQIDPLKYGLVFERFLNSERREMPDIDMDFPDNRRGEVIKYCGDKYGKDHMAQIVTFMKMGARAALRDVARVMGDIKKGDELARLVPGFNVSLPKALEASPELRKLRDGEDKQYGEIIEKAAALEGTVRHASTHAAGVVISEKPLTETVPLQMPTSSQPEDGDYIPTTQFAMEDVARIGLLKMDFLGLRNLSVLDATVKLIGARRGVAIDLYSLELDDEPTFKLLSSGETYGVFQLESSGMRSYIADLKPNSVDEISAMIALYRPGPMEHIGEYIESKHGRRQAEYPHEDLKGILEETYGVIVYQDQILKIAQQFGGYTLGQADILRKAMGKKIPAVMAEQRGKFIEGAQAKGYSKELAERIFKLVEPFAGYAFNKAHSVSYAIIGYWTAYMKANYPLEYYTCLLSSFSGNANSVSQCVSEVSAAGFQVLVPHINKSGKHFTIAEPEEGEGQEDGGKGAIRYGLMDIKNVGESMAEAILQERKENGEFKSLEDFCSRADVTALNSAALQGLTRAGALDALGNRGALDRANKEILGIIRENTHARNANQASLFGSDAPALSVPLGEEQDDSHLYGIWESEALGRTVSKEFMLPGQQGGQQVLFADVDKMPDGATLEFSAVLMSVSRRKSKAGNPFLSCKAQLMDGSLELTVWADLLAKTADAWGEGRQVTVKGQVKRWQGEVSVAVREVLEHSGGADAPPAPPPPQSNGAGQQEQQAPQQEAAQAQAAANGASGSAEAEAKPAGKPMVLCLEEFGSLEMARAGFQSIMPVLRDHSGSVPVELEVRTNGRTVRMDMPGEITVAAEEGLKSNLLAIKGVLDVRMP